jgi:hypothetical protein
MTTINLHASQLPEMTTKEEITYSDEVGEEIILITFSGDGTRFVSAEIFDPVIPTDEYGGEIGPAPESRPLSLLQAISMLKSVKRHGDWWNPNTKRFLGFWVKKNTNS